MAIGADGGAVGEFDAVALVYCWGHVRAEDAAEGKVGYIYSACRLCAVPRQAAARKEGRKERQRT